MVRIPTHGPPTHPGETLPEPRSAGTMEAGTGHHHLFIDRDIVAVDWVIPVEPGIVHLGAARTE